MNDKSKGKKSVGVEGKKKRIATGSADGASKMKPVISDKGKSQTPKKKKK